MKKYKNDSQVVEQTHPVNKLLSLPKELSPCHIKPLMLRVLGTNINVCSALSITWVHGLLGSATHSNPAILVTRIDSSDQATFFQLFRVQTMPMSPEEQLNDKESNLSLLNTLIEDRLSVDTITEDIEASEEIKEKIIFWKTKLSSKIRRINSDSIQVDTVSRNIQVIDSNSFECMNINLPKLHINKYSGNYSEWLDFYNLFESSIHNNNRLSKVDKFNYLKSYLCGNALACINGFPISDDNYDRALDLLKDRFGNKNMLINAHLSNLLNLTPVRNPTDIVGLRNLYDRAETQIRSLESLGVKGENPTQTY
ncbi:uncharacterized protein TNCV_4117661 [Trichonephila clavipes]|nr:uncharacterized protein TNCV_4117661 [Trichonephila clavipes]